VLTIAQFRTIDFKMESCSATLEVPSLADVENLPQKKVSASPESCTLEIWSLDVDVNANPRIFSWDASPRSIDLLGTMFVGPRPNLLSTPLFHCPSHTLLALEISSSIPGCHLHFRQNTHSPRLGEQRTDLGSHKLTSSLKRFMLPSIRLVSKL
ncbi:hypothetical protein DFH06DRAFT_1003175, partial [Mycena polygramma]